MVVCASMSLQSMKCLFRENEGMCSSRCNYPERTVKKTDRPDNESREMK